MDSRKLAQELMHPKSVPLRTNHFATTWQVSHVACATTDAGVVESAEGFLAGVVWSGVGGWSSHVTDPRPWVQRADFEEWARGLRIEPLALHEWMHAIRQAESDLREADEKPSMTVAWLESASVVRGWALEETRQRRHPVGATKSFVVLTDTEWIFFEVHWES